MERFVEACVISNVGKVRKSNQDNFIFQGSIAGVENEQNQQNYTKILDATSVFTAGVFDGMGGESYGDLAAFIAAKEYKEYSESNLRGVLDMSMITKSLLEYYLKANKTICDECTIRKSRMGTTAAILVISESQAVISNIGDSRIYRVRNYSLELLSCDHTENTLLMANNLRLSNKKGRLTQYLGVFEDEYIIEPYIVLKDIQINDIYLVCSDGITDMLSDKEIETIINSDSNALEATVNLVNKAIENGGSDNCTAIVCIIR